MVALVTARPRKITAILYEAQRGICPACGRKMPPLGDPCLLQHVPSIDHVVARSRGGSDDIRNKMVMHSVCNSLKGNRDPTGCEVIWHHLVLARIDLHPLDIEYREDASPNPAMADAFMAALSKVH